MKTPSDTIASQSRQIKKLREEKKELEKLIENLKRSAGSILAIIHGREKNVVK